MKRSFRLAMVVGVLFVIAFASSSHAGLFGPKGKDAEDKRTNIRQQRDEMLSELIAREPKMKEKIGRASGYATFKQVSVNLLLLASANGYGMVVDNKQKKETFMRMASLGGGVGAGVKDLRVIFIFNDPSAMKQFIEQGLQFGGQADVSAKYQETGVSGEQTAKAAVNYKDGTVDAGTSTELAAGAGDEGVKENVATRGGMEIYQFTESGLSLQATVSGTKYWKDSKLNK